MVDETTTDDAVTEDAPVTDDITEDTPTEDAPAVDEPGDDINLPAQIADLTERLDVQAQQIEVLTKMVDDLRNENADLIETVTDSGEPEVIDSHNTGDEFHDELFD